jgi:anti-sigma B factor antagonist
MLLTTNIERLPNDTAVVTFQGSLTLGTALKFADSQVQSAIADGVSRVVFDMAGVDYLDSAGLGLLIFVYGTLTQKNGALRLCSVAPRVISLLQITKTDALLTIDRSREDSLAGLN